MEKLIKFRFGGSLIDDIENLNFNKNLFFILLHTKLYLEEDYF